MCVSVRDRLSPFLLAEEGHPFALPGTVGESAGGRGLQEAALTDERDGTALLNPGHVLAAADADRATFDADRGGAKLEEMSGIAVAVVDIVQSPGPSPRSIRHQTVENRDADKRAAALRRVRIVLVCPRPSGLRIDRGSRGGDSRAQGATARSDLHVGAVLRQPKALGIGRRRSCAKQRTKRHGGRSTKPWKLHSTYSILSALIARASLNLNLGVTRAKRVSLRG